MAEEYLTKEGYDKIVEEYEMLVSVKRREVSERLKEAISYGDISENAEYDAAKDEQAEMEDRIFKLEKMIKSAKIIDEMEVSNDFIGVGAKIKIKELESGEVYDYIIVGTTEADPFVGKISNESLIGQNLLGKKVDDVVEILVPDGTFKYQVLEINR